MKISVTIFFILLGARLFASDHEVRGRVLSLNNQPMGGVNVILKGTTNGTVTDMNGFFKILLPEGPVVLFFIFMKQKPLELPFTMRTGYQYQINVGLASKAQTFNKSFAVTAELPIDSPKITGRVADQNNKSLAGVSITQSESAFTTTTDAGGNFSIPVPYGENILSFSFSGVKRLHFPLNVKDGSTPALEVFLVAQKNKYRKRESFVRTAGAADGK